MNSSKRYFLIFSLFLSLNLYSIEFKPGEGSQFIFTQNSGVKSDLSIYIADKNDKSIFVEYHFLSNSFITQEMWQQYELRFESKSILNLHQGFIKTSKLSNSEKLDRKYLNINDGVKIQDFLFSKKEDLERFKIADEMIEVPAGSVMTTHYKKERNGQVIDFWISEEAPPISLVKLKSVHPKDDNKNYRIELKNLLKNVKKTISPGNSVPMSDKSKKFLEQKSKD